MSKPKYILTEQFLRNVSFKSILNSDGLMDDAFLLFSKKRWSRSYTLYQIAIEEIGKAMMCLLLFDSKKYETPEAQKEFVEYFTNHKGKTFYSSTLDLTIAGILSVKHPDGKNLVMKNISNHFDDDGITESNNLKNFSLYTSIVGELIQNPSDVITRDMVNKLKFHATTRSALSKFIFNAKFGDTFDASLKEIMDSRII